MPRGIDVNGRAASVGGRAVPIGPTVGIPDSTVAHYDAQALSASAGDSITTWTDKTSNNNDATGGSPTYRTSAINGLPALEFDGADDEFSASIGTHAQPNTILAVAEFTGVAGNSGEYITDGLNARQILGLRNTGSWGGYSGTWLAGDAFDGEQLVAGVYDAGDSGVRVSESTATSGDAGSDGLDGLRIGASSTANGAFWNGYIAEILVCNADLRATGELAEQESRMALRWRI